MMFLTLEDRTGCADVIVWPDTYDRLYDELQESGPFEVRGKVTEEYDTFSIAADDVRAVPWSPGIIDLKRASERLAKSFTNTTVYPDVTMQAA